jgi:hypothetical protein
MSKSNHSEAQMIGALKQMEAGRKAEDVPGHTCNRRNFATKGTNKLRF